MNNKYEREAAKRRFYNVYSHSYEERDWSDQDSLPTGDPIGDIDEKQNQNEQFKADQEKYMNEMKSRVMFPASKNFDVEVAPKSVMNSINIYKQKKCNCGVAKAYKNPSLKMHSSWCELKDGDN